MKRSLRILRLAVCSALVAGVALFAPWAGDTVAQGPAPSKSDAQVIRLKNTRASEVARVLQQLFGGGTGRGGFGKDTARIAVAADDASNSVVVSAGADDLATVQRLITALDAIEADPAKGPVRQELKVFQLRSAPDKALQDALRLIYAGKDGLESFAIDPRRNAVICSGSKNTLETVEALLARLDDNAGRIHGAERRVRIVWLVDSAAVELNTKQLAQPPDDLKEVLGELAKFGIAKPRLAAQSIVSAMENVPFRVEGSTILGDTPCMLNISGQLLEEHGKPNVRVELKATQDAGPRAAKITVCSMETQVSAPLGHAVVLGMTPTSGMTSVFVVQILSAEPTKVRAR